MPVRILWATEWRMCARCGAGSTRGAARSIRTCRATSWSEPVMNYIGPDTVIIFLVILLLFGARKAPKLVRDEEEEEDAKRTPGQWLDVAAIISLVVAGILWLVLLTP